MSKREETERRTEVLLLPLLEKRDLKLWDVEYVNEASQWYLRAYIDKPGGVTIDDCVDVSRELSQLLDMPENDYISDPYTLEISSPGLGRTLKRDRDFENSLGREVDLKLYKAEDGVKEFSGLLKAWDKDTITADIDGEDRIFNRKALASVKLSFEP